jgi:hypothetical protein
MPTNYTYEFGRRAIPHLVQRAKQRRTITYKELAEKIGTHPRPIRHVLAYVRDEICASRGLPKLTAIVISQITRLPGDSFLPEGTGHLNQYEYARRAEEEQHRVFDYANWNALIEELGLRPAH